MLDMWTVVVFFFKQKTAYEMRISDWSSDVCSSDLHAFGRGQQAVEDGLALGILGRHPIAQLRAGLRRLGRLAGEGGRGVRQRARDDADDERQALVATGGDRHRATGGRLAGFAKPAGRQRGSKVDPPPQNGS